MADHTEVEFDTTGGPRASQRDVPEFHDLIPVDELVASLLDARSPHFSPDLGQNPDFDPVVLERDDRPLAGFGLMGVPLEPMVRIKTHILRQHRDRIGIRKRIGIERTLGLGDRGPCLSGYLRYTREQRDQK